VGQEGPWPAARAACGAPLSTRGHPKSTDFAEPACRCRVEVDRAPTILGNRLQALGLESRGLALVLPLLLPGLHALPVLW